MIMTRETDYAIRIIRALSCGGQVSVPRISELELVPVPFAYKITKKLSQAGYIEIVRGVDGGCRLLADLRELSLLDVLKCINEEVYVNACIAPGYECRWRTKNCGGCSVHSGLEKIQAEIERELSSHKVVELL